MSKKLFAAIGLLAVATLVVSFFLSNGRNLGMSLSKNEIGGVYPPATPPIPAPGFDGRGVVSSEVMQAEPMILPYPTDEALDVTNRVMEKSSFHQLVVDDVSTHVNSLKDYVNSLGGLMLNSTVSQEDKYQTAYLTAKVPVDRFDEAVASVSQGAKKVFTERVNAYDVTASVVNLQEEIVRLEAEISEKEAEIAEYERASLEWQRANNQLTSLQRQLDNVKNQLENTEERVEYSTMTIILANSERYFKGQMGVYEPDLVDVVREAWESLGSSLRFVVMAVIWLAVYSVLWAPVVLVIWWLKKRKDQPRVE